MDLKNRKILVVGASSDIARELNRLLAASGAKVGLHYNSNAAFASLYDGNVSVKTFKKNLSSLGACHELIDEFAVWAGGIDSIIQLSGDIKRPVHWESLTENDWNYDLEMNLTMPFFLAQRAVHYMKENGGRIIFTSTASAAHGGGASSLAYGAAKAGIECITRGIARDCAKYNILVNAIAPGFIKTKFHTEKMQRTEKQLEERAKLIPLRRSGTTAEIAGSIMFLLSEESGYITGQIIAVSGGDWL